MALDGLVRTIERPMSPVSTANNRACVGAWRSQSVDGVYMPSELGTVPQLNTQARLEEGRSRDC